jgi:hypothetical protein
VENIIALTSTTFDEFKGQRLPPLWTKLTIHHSFQPMNFGSQFKFEVNEFEEKTGSIDNWPCSMNTLSALNRPAIDGLKLNRKDCRKDCPKGFQCQKQEFHRQGHLTLADLPVPENSKEIIKDEDKLYKIVFDMIQAAAKSSRIASRALADHQESVSQKSDRDFWQPLFLFFGIGIEGFICSTDTHLFGTGKGIIDKKCYTLFPIPSPTSTDTRLLKMPQGPSDSNVSRAGLYTLRQTLVAIKGQYDLLDKYSTST